MTPEIAPAGHLERSVYHCFCAGMDDPSCIPQPAQGKHQERKFRQCIMAAALTAARSQISHQESNLNVKPM